MDRLRTRVLCVATAVVVSGCEALPQPPGPRLEPGQEATWSIEYENHSEQSLAVYTIEGWGANRGSWLEPCMAGGSTRTLVAPFTIHLGPATPAGVDSRPTGEIEAMPVLLDSANLAVAPGAVGYRLTIDAQGSLAEIRPIDELSDPPVKRLC